MQREWQCGLGEPRAGDLIERKSLLIRKFSCRCLQVGTSAEIVWIGGELLFDPGPATAGHQVSSFREMRPQPFPVENAQ